LRRAPIRFRTPALPGPPAAGAALETGTAESGPATGACATPPGPPASPPVDAPTPASQPACPGPRRTDSQRATQVTRLIRLTQHAQDLVARPPPTGAETLSAAPQGAARSLLGRPAPSHLPPLAKAGHAHLLRAADAGPPARAPNHPRVQRAANPPRGPGRCPGGPGRVAAHCLAGRRSWAR
jgi:hypothetical protein